MLVKCPDCNKEISDMAPACPGCGRPKDDGQTITIQTDHGPISMRMPDLYPKCPLCGGQMVPMDARARGQVLGGGNIFGSIRKSSHCNGCGHLE